MTASLVTFRSDEPAARENWLKEAWHTRFHELRLAIDNGQVKELKACWEHFSYADMRYGQYLETRARRCEIALRRVLDQVDDAERARLLECLYGPIRTKLRHTSELIPSEQKLISDYRSLDDKSRAIVRLLCDRLAAVPEPAGGVR